MDSTGPSVIEVLDTWWLNAPIAIALIGVLIWYIRRSDAALEKKDANFLHSLDKLAARHEEGLKQVSDSLTSLMVSQREHERSMLDNQRAHQQSADDRLQQVAYAAVAIYRQNLSLGKEHGEGKREG